MKRKKAINFWTKFRIVDKTEYYGLGWVIQRRRKCGRKLVPEYATLQKYFVGLGPLTAQFSSASLASKFRKEIIKIPDARKLGIFLKDMKVVPMRWYTSYQAGR